MQPNDISPNIFHIKACTYKVVLQVSLQIVVLTWLCKSLSHIKACHVQSDVSAKDFR